MSGRGKLAAAVALAGLLAACGNDPNAGIAGRKALEAVRQYSAVLLARFNRKGAPQASSAPQGTLLTPIEDALQSTDGKVLLAVIEKDNNLAIMGVAATNGAYETWETAKRESMILKRGVLTGSRGLGYDLMSAQADETIALLTARREGRAQRSYQFLTGTGATSTLRVSCEISKGGSERVSAGEIDVEAEAFAEICTSGPLQIQNLFWVDKAGHIVKSRQWLSPQVGYILFQHLRM